MTLSEKILPSEIPILIESNAVVRMVGSQARKIVKEHKAYFILVNFY